MMPPASKTCTAWYYFRLWPVIFRAATAILSSGIFLSLDIYQSAELFLVITLLR